MNIVIDEVTFKICSMDVYFCSSVTPVFFFGVVSVVFGATEATMASGFFC